MAATAEVLPAASAASLVPTSSSTLPIRSVRFQIVSALTPAAYYVGNAGEDEPIGNPDGAIVSGGSCDASYYSACGGMCPFSHLR